ncbi:MAG: putative addiction module CopG family antidote [Halioglobus sp.]|jgi:putative addiction module CopG family antidote
MRRIQIGKPYEQFLESMVESGYYATATEVIRDALRQKMLDMRNINIVKVLIEEAEEDIAQGRLNEVTPELFDRLKKEAVEEFYHL